MGLFARVRSDMPRLVFKPVEGLVTNCTFVRPFFLLFFGIDIGGHGDGLYGFGVI